MLVAHHGYAPVVGLMNRAYKMRAYPTRGQAIRATTLLGVHCDLYNAALQERRDAFAHPSRTRIRPSRQHGPDVK